MGTIFSGKKISRTILIVSVMLAVMSPAIVHAAAASMQDYCQVPPFIGVTKPNLLLVIDNSASMFDLEYVDRGRNLCNPSGVECVTNFDCPNKVCSATTTTACATDSNCPSGEFCKPTETCSVVRRTASYCYDESYSSRKAYEGYFDRLVPNTNLAQYYQYDFVADYFVPAAAFPADLAACQGVNAASKFIPNALCVQLTSTSPKTVVGFIASGNYLNWLTASKFDIEKGILTGGKYAAIDAANYGLYPESRGCVGRKYIKEPVTADFVNYDTGVADPNTGLGITFGVRGPKDPNNPANVSTGGRTYIEIYDGDYNAQNCQDAIDLFLDPTSGKQEIVDAVNTCLSNSATNKKTCSLDPATECNSDADCAGTPGTCNITVGSCGSAGGVCGVNVAGACLVNNGTCTGAKKCVGGNRPGIVCARDQDCTGNGTCTPTCSGGGKDGAFCNIDAQCAYSACSAGQVGNPCNINSDCDTKWCTNGAVGDPQFHRACLNNADCNVGTCLAPLSKVGNMCSVNTDCNDGVCAVGSPVNEGLPCASNDQCSLGFKGFCMAPVTTQIKSTFTQSMNSCYQFTRKGIDIGINELQQISNPNGCNQIYKETLICNGGSSDGNPCTALGAGAECPGGSCINGVDAIRPGSPVLLCSKQYTGFCASTLDNWTNTIWNSRTYASPDECILAKYREYCGAVQIPPVVDPTDDPSSTTNYDNLPAIINDVGLVAQLRDPIKTMETRLLKSSTPIGLIQEFASMIRLGAMGFDFNGSKAECGVMKYCSNDNTRTCAVSTDCVSPGVCVAAVPCPYVCSNDTEKPCTLQPDGTTFDCPGGNCVLSSTLGLFGLSDTNKDGSHILADSYIGDAIPTTPNGGHTVAGIVKAIDEIGGAAWTPFSEAFYNATGYYAQTSMTNRLSAQMLNRTYPDFFTPVDAPSKTQPSQSNCQKNNVLLITDGQPTADLNADVSSVITNNAGRFPAADYSLTYDTTFNNTCYLYAGSRNVDDLSWLAQHRNIHDNFATAPTYDKDRIRTYTVFSGTGTLTQPDCTAKTDAQLAAMNECSTDNLMCKTARNGKGTYYLAQDPAALKQSLKNAFLEIAAKATSGTAASVLASGEGSGANLIQALFYPRRTFDFNTETLWAGSLQNLWYFVDPFFTNSNIREDTNPNKILDLTNDYVVRLWFNNNPIVNKVQVDRARDTDGDGDPDTYVDTIDIEDIGSLWESGMLLWARDPATRKIYTDCGINPGNCVLDVSAQSTGVMNFSAANFDTAAGRHLYMQAADAAERDNIINFTTGAFDGDNTTYRKRTVAMDLNGNTTPDAGEAQVWKLGDVLNSTPKIASWMPLNTYSRIYGDSTYGLPYQDLNPSDGDNEAFFVTSRTTYPQYRNRGMVFAGANDGMLHAFRLGTLQLKWAGAGTATDPAPAQAVTQHARLLRTCSKSNRVCTADGDCGAGDTCPQLGQEMWAYIPKNALPYLKYMADANYCHVYTVDLTPLMFDASIEGPNYNVAACPGGNYWNCTRTKDSWRTIVIGGMRYGGACKTKVCSVTTATKCAKDTDCPVAETCGNPSADTIGAPLLDPADPTKGLGLSSYFALDVTESLSDASKPPRLLWEFSHEELGLTSAAPAVVRIKALTNPAGAFDPSTNPPETAPGTRDGRWFVVLGSGPTGPISDTQNLGRSDQRLKLFVLDLKDGSLQKAIDTGIDNAFAGTMSNATFDSNLDYQDDVVYFGYVKKSALAGTWTDGGVGRLLMTTGSGASVNDALAPNNWEFSKVIDDIGPVTSAVVKLQNKKTFKLWTYFGTGRYIFKTSTESDDNAGRRTLFGVTDPCYNGNSWPDGPFEGTCAAAAFTRARGDLNDATDASLAQTDPEGWLVDLEDVVPDPDPALALGAERVVTDPLATSSGLVFFITFAPYADICTLGGKSYIWALNYDTAEPPGAMLMGKAMVQVSTGSIEQVDLSTAFTEKDNRRTTGMVGMPPGGQPPVSVPPPPVKRILHMKER